MACAIFWVDTGGVESWLAKGREICLIGVARETRVKLMPTDAILTTARQYLGVDPSVPIRLEPIKKGASGRTIVRVLCEVCEPMIGVYWTDERPDNEKFVPVAQFLKQARMRVPGILHENMKRRVALVEDLGNVDLTSLGSFAEREPYYRMALEQIDRMFYLKAPKDFELMPSFDFGMYRWEQEYFIEHLVEGHLGLSGEKLRESGALLELAERLGKSAPHLVHRDFQSQNLLVCDDQVWMIDFQGMRKGRQEYDLASLIYDPYLNHTAEEREKLLQMWEEIADDRPEATIFRECAMQRLMQAMGAFGNIVRTRQDEWYRPHIATARELLRGLVAGTSWEDLFAEVFFASLPEPVEI